MKRAALLKRTRKTRGERESLNTIRSLEKGQEVIQEGDLQAGRAERGSKIENIYQ